MDNRVSVGLKTIRDMKELRAKPASLREVLAHWSKVDDVEPPVSDMEFLGWLRDDPPVFSIKVRFHDMIASWDYAAELAWASGTMPNTPARREVIGKLLALDADQAAEIDRLFPPYPGIDQPIRIEADDKRADWYSALGNQRGDFYWRAYERYLLQAKRWDPKNVAVLDTTSSDIVADFRDPMANPNAQTKGLVVGYVQSGKTANFTGVIAKAIDAGYRFVIVLAGLQNTLRNQTQRRIDKELVGCERLESTGEYRNDSDWPDFNAHGDIPDRIGAFNIDRLTTSTVDFQRPFGDVAGLRFSKHDPHLPFWREENASRHPVKLVVVKKNPTPLRNLLKALEGEAKVGTPWSEVPSIIIDDESDQASLNTKKPTAREVQQRTAINKLIVKISGVLQRAQYVGYTATPFANVFANPDDADDIFPSDFIISLPRPEGYMGVRDFYDPPGTTEKLRDPYTNYGRHIRPVIGTNELQANLPQALDAFVLAGAVKLYREAHGYAPFRHHTMLVHVSTRTHVHEELRGKIVKLFAASGYATGGTGLARIRKLWETDFSPVSHHCKVKGLPVPDSFDALAPHIGECVVRIAGDGDCVLVLNGEDTENSPDFDKAPVWKVIVGGAKLSRGYTVEGLTVSYYRRTTGAADTLMQMGRWFGYREGYRDLVRLYIGTEEPRGSKTINLYEAFRGVCEDEEEFRAQLSRYSRLEGEERLTPKQIPPLVPSHLLQPSARNKMYNATLVFVNFGEAHKERTVASIVPKIKSSNADAMKTLLAEASMSNGVIDGSVCKPFAAMAGVVSNAEMLTFLGVFRYGTADSDQRELVLIREFIEGKHGDPKIDDWALIAPTLKDSGKPDWKVPGVGTFKIRKRGRTDARYGVFSEPNHVGAARMIAHLTDGSPSNPFTRKLAHSRRGVMLFYPVLADHEKGIPTMGFSLDFPTNNIPKAIRYGVKVPDRPTDVVVDAMA